MDSSSGNLARAMQTGALAIAIAAACTHAALGDVPGQPAALLTLGNEERAALAAKAARPELQRALVALSIEDLIALGKKSLAGLGVYGVRLVKQERVKGRLLDPQTLELVLRDRPLAVRATFVAGPAKGRRLVYNAELRKDELRVREGGFFGLLAVWVNLDSGLTRGDTNHRATDLGFGALLDLISRDLELARPHGGFSRTDEGFDDRGLFCMRFDAPRGVIGLSGDRTRICIDVALGLPQRTEVYGGAELLERYVFEKVSPRLVVPPNYFTPEAAGL